MSKETVSRITDKVIEEMAEWANRPIYAAIGVTRLKGLPEVVSNVWPGYGPSQRLQPGPFQTGTLAWVDSWNHSILPG